MCCLEKDNLEKIKKASEAYSISACQNSETEYFVFQSDV